MVLLQKEFKIDIAKIDKRFAAITSSNYDGIIKSDNNFIVQWKTTPSNQDIAAIELYWRDLTEQVYNTPTTEEQAAMLAKILEDAKTFGNALIVQFAAENIAMGITNVGKTRAVADYCHKLQYYLSNGSLYAAKEEIEDMIDEPPSELAPFITAQRLTIYLNKIKTYLKIPIT